MPPKCLFNLLQATTLKPNFNTNSARAPWAPKLRPIKRVHARYAAIRSATCNPGDNAGGTQTVREESRRTEVRERVG